MISYIVFLIFTVLMYIGDDKLNNMIPYTGFILMGFSFILLTPGLLIYGLIPGVIKPCPSDNDVLGWFTCGFLFYSIVIWGILKLIKKSEKSRTIEIKQNNEAEKQTPTETEK